MEPWATVLLSVTSSIGTAEGFLSLFSFFTITSAKSNNRCHNFTFLTSALPIGSTSTPTLIAAILGWLLCSA